MLKGCIYKIVGDVHLTEELAHDAFLRLYEKAKFFDPLSSQSRSFLFKIGKNLAYDFIRRKNNELKKCNKIFIEDVVMDKNFYKDIEDMYIEGEVISTINDTIDSFPAGKRDIYVNRVFEGKRYKKIMSDFKISKFKINKIENEINSKIKHNLEYPSGKKRK